MLIDKSYVDRTYERPPLCQTSGRSRQATAVRLTRHLHGCATANLVFATCACFCSAIQSHNVWQVWAGLAQQLHGGLAGLLFSSLMMRAVRADAWTLFGTLFGMLAVSSPVTLIYL